MNFRMLIFPVLALVFNQALAQVQSQKLSVLSCDVTKYANVLYKKDNLLGPNKGLPASTFDECVEQCLTRTGCKAVNYVDTQKPALCMFLTSGFTSASPDKSSYQDWKNAFHAVISCPPPKASGPVGCGKQHASNKPIGMNQRVVGGVEAKKHSWPWQVLLDIDLRNGYRSTCGSTLIRVKDGVESSDILVTAGHCVHGKSDAIINAIAGNHHRNKYEPGEQHAIGAKVLIHPSYSPSPRNDIALIKLDKPFLFSDTVRPICLPKQGEALPTGKTCAASGWGRNNSRDATQTSEVLLQVRTPAHDAATCKKGWSGSYVEDQMVCAGSLDATSDTCEGDSGGMLACVDGDSWKLYGATSFGVSGPCLGRNQPGVYARVSSYVDWIMQNARAMSSV